MKKITLISLFFAAGAFAQQPASLQQLNEATLASAISLTDTTVTLSANTTVASPSSNVPVASVINLPSLFNTQLGKAVGSYFYVIDSGSQLGEAMQVVSFVGGTTYSVKRGFKGTRATAHVTPGAIVLIGAPQAFYDADPSGACGLTNTPGQYPSFEFQAYSNPVVVVSTGKEWLCSTTTLTWVPGFNNPNDNYSTTTAVASAAGLITPSGPLFHVTGTAAITGFNLPVGFASGSFTIIPDAIFTVVAGGNNIGTAATTTAAVGRPLTYVYDTATAKFYGSY